MKIQMQRSKLTLALGTIGLAVAVAGPAAAQKTRSPASPSTVDVRVELKRSAKPPKGAATSSAASVFRAVPGTVTITAAPGVKLAKSPRTKGVSKLSFATDGKSTCVKVFAEQTGTGVVALEYAFVNRGDKDPCTGKAVVNPSIDYTTETPPPVGYWQHRYWRLQCGGGNGCHWIHVTCRHSQGID